MNIEQRVKELLEENAKLKDRIGFLEAQIELERNSKSKNNMGISLEHRITEELDAIIPWYGERVKL